jgi:hypothetical protein
VQFGIGFAELSGCSSVRGWIQVQVGSRESDVDVDVDAVFLLPPLSKPAGSRSGQLEPASESKPSPALPARSLSVGVNNRARKGKE